MPSAITCKVVSSHRAGIRENEFHLIVQLFVNHSLAEILAERSLAEGLPEEIRFVLKKYKGQGGGVIVAAWVASILSKKGFNYIPEPEIRLNLDGSEKILGPYDLAVAIEVEKEKTTKYLVLEIKLLRKQRKKQIREINKIYEGINTIHEAGYAKLAKKCGVYIGLLVVDISGVSVSAVTTDYIAVVRATGGWGDEEKVVEEIIGLARRLGLPV